MDNKRITDLDIKEEIKEKFTDIDQTTDAHEKRISEIESEMNRHHEMIYTNLDDDSESIDAQERRISKLEKQIADLKLPPTKHTEQGRHKIINLAKEKLGCLAYDDCYDVNFITFFFPSDTFLVFRYVEQFCKLANTRLHRIAVREGGLDLEFELL